jgi:hypothetical protein
MMVSRKQVAGQERVGLRPQEPRPGRPGSSGCGVDAGRAQDRPERGRSDPVAGAGERAVDAAVAPGEDLGGQAHDQGADTGEDVGAAGRDGQVVQRRARSCRCPRRLVVA